MFAGSRQLQVHDDAKGLSFPVLILYPTEVPSAPTAFGPYAFDVSREAPVAEGNNRNDNSLEGTYENLVRRPRHIRLTIDAVSQALGAHVQQDNVAVLGHSMGGYAALAVAGGIPWSKNGERVAVTPDPRVRALVLLAPGTAFYYPEDSLRDVKIPILMLTAEHDPVTPRWQAELLLDRVPDRDQVTWKEIENAGHFSFLSPFPPHMRNPGFLPSTDPEGFDREQLHERLPGEILDFWTGR